MAYVPEAGDIVWLHCTPEAGQGQAGPRPALVFSPVSYDRIGLMLCCPMTTRAKGYPFEVAIAGEGGSILPADRAKSLDWRVRKAKPKGTATE